MALRPAANRQLFEPSDREVLDFHVVADILGKQRTGINNLIGEWETGFSDPSYELRYKKSHPLKLCWSEDTEIWKINGGRNREN